LFLGLGGTTQNAGYLAPWFDVYERLGITLAVINRKTNQVSTHADIQDMSLCLSWLKNKFSDSRRIAVGYSSGGNHLVKTLGAMNDQTIVEKAITISTNHYLPDLLELLYKNDFMNQILGFSVKKVLLKQLNMHYSRITEIDSVIADYFGYRDLQNYWENVSSLQELREIRIPTLIVFSQDDILCESMLSKVKDIIDNNENVTAIVTKYGGHVTWLTHKSRTPWIIDTVMAFSSL